MMGEFCDKGKWCFLRGGKISCCRGSTLGTQECRGFKCWHGVQFGGLVWRVWQRMWWKSFSECQQTQPLPTSAPMQPWSWPTRPWSRLHVDFAGPLECIVVDAHSVVEVILMKTATALTTVQRLRTLFSRFRVPELIVADNRPQFAAEELQEFCRRNAI